MSACEVVNCPKTKGAGVIGFIVGAAIGSLTAYYILKKRYINKLNEDLHNVVIMPEEQEKSVEQDELHPVEDPSPEDAPYVITQKEFVEEDGYTKMTVIYYNDGVLADPFDNEMVIDDTIGREVLGHFGEDEEDTAYARNPKLGIDYEVCKEDKTYASLMEEE